MYLTEPSRIPEIDAYAAEKLGIPVLDMMERAGACLAEETARRIPAGGRVLILAGPGNNGGDGYAAALRLLDSGFRVRVCDVLGAGQRSEAGQHYAALCETRLGSPILLSELTDEEIFTSDAVIDAVLGTGARFELTDELAALFARVAAAPPSVLRVAADAPTGIDAEDGRACRSSFRADLTVTFAFGKRGMYAYPAREYCGEIVVADIGLPAEEIAAAFPPSGALLERQLAASMLPRRPRNTHKGSFGKLLILAGSRAYRGAAMLASEAALRAGAGVVTLASHESVIEPALSRTPELLTLAIPDLDRVDREGQRAVYGAAEKASAILVGCGSGSSVPLSGLLWELLASEGAPLVIDADGLNSLSLHREESLHRLRKSRRGVILTPHPLELSRLTGLPTSRIQSERIGAARAFAEETGATVVLKGAGTVIVTAGERITLNPTGGPALSKAGSGDVLAGTAAAFLAQGIAPHHAACLSVYLHGAAGDTLAQELSEYGVLPGDLPRAIAREIRALERMRAEGCHVGG